MGDLYSKKIIFHLLIPIMKSLLKKNKKKFDNFDKISLFKFY